MSNQIEERKNRLEGTLSTIAGVPVQLTVRGDVSFTISANGNCEAELMQACKFLGRQFVTCRLALMPSAIARVSISMLRSEGFTMSKNEIIARMCEIFQSSALDVDESPESQEFDRLEAEFVARFGESEFTYALDRLLGHLMEL